MLSKWTSLRRHIEDKHTTGGAHVCPFCQHVYRTRNSLHNHLSVYHRGASSGRGRRPRFSAPPEVSIVALQAAAAAAQQQAWNAAVAAAVSSGTSLSSSANCITSGDSTNSTSTSSASSISAFTLEPIPPRQNTTGDFQNSDETDSTGGFESLLSGDVSGEVTITPTSNSSHHQLVLTALSDD